MFGAGVTVSQSSSPVPAQSSIIR